MPKPKSATRRLLRQQLCVMASARLAAEGAASEGEGGGGVAGGAAGEGAAGEVVAAPDGAAGEVVAAAGDGADAPSAKEKRSTKKKIRPGGWVPTIPVEDLPPLGTRVEAIQKYEEAMLDVEELNEAIRSRVDIPPVEDTPKFYISTDCSPEEFLQFIEELNQHSLNVAPFKVKTEIDGVEVDVPVTPMEPPDIENAGYRIIVLRCPGQPYQIYILVEDFGGYIKAVSIVLIGGAIQHWHRLGKDALPTRFSPSSFTNYDHGYGDLTGVYMDNNMLNVIFRFFLDFIKEPKQKATKKGKRILYTSFIVLGETPRFPLAKGWTVEGLSRDPANRLYLPIWFSGLIHDWKPLSLAILELFIALLEERMVKDGCPTPDAEKAMVDARLIWRNCQVPHKIVKFFLQEDGVADEATPIFMKALCGKVVTLIRHDYEVGNKALLRLSRYDGYLSDGHIQAAYVAGKLA